MHFFTERVITQVFGRPYDLEEDKYKGVDIITEINNAMNEICKKKKKKKKAKKDQEIRELSKLFSERN